MSNDEGAGRPRRSPWRTLSTRSVYENPWIHVREDAVIRPDGAEGIYGVVETPLAAGIVALTEDERVHLVGQWRYSMGQWSWEIVEGGAAREEPSLTAAQRELREEAGLIAQDWRVLGDEIHLSNSFTDERAHIFLATGLSKVAAEPDPTEQLELRCEPLDVCFDLVDRGEIKDAISVVALLRLERWRRRGRPPLPVARPLPPPPRGPHG